MTQTNSASSVPVITIDGTSGVGKGTACSVVAQKLGWHILDSGSLYRLAALKTSRDANDNNLDQVVDYAKNLDVDYRPGDGELRVFLEGEDVTDQIRTEEVGAVASQIAAEPAIREALLLRQKAFAMSPGLVADGRDMGTVVFPEANLKIFLTAGTEERAKRRYKQLIDKGLSANLPTLIAELEARDERDTNRSVSPLRAADDAVIIDTTHIGIEQVVDKVMSLVEERFKN
jgi:cytidylate kinase